MDSRPSAAPGVRRAAAALLITGVVNMIVYAEMISRGYLDAVTGVDILAVK